MDIKFEQWTAETQFIRPSWAETVRKRKAELQQIKKPTMEQRISGQQADSYTLDELLWLAHWMSTDGNHTDEECVRGYAECLTQEGFVAFIAGLNNACMIEGEGFPLNVWVERINSEYMINITRNTWAELSKHILKMQCHDELLEKLLLQIGT